MDRDIRVTEATRYREIQFRQQWLRFIAWRLRMTPWWNFRARKFWRMRREMYERHIQHFTAMKGFSPSEAAERHERYRQWLLEQGARSSR